MSIIEQNSQIPNMYKLRHKHDVEHEDYAYDYTDKLFDNTVSKFLLINEKNKKFTQHLSRIFTIMIDSSESIKNMFYYTHSKYYNKNGR